MLVCVECGSEINGTAHVERVEDLEDEDARPELAFFCPECAEFEFGD